MTDVSRKLEHVKAQEFKQTDLPDLLRNLDAYGVLHRRTTLTTKQTGDSRSLVPERRGTDQDTVESLEANLRELDNELKSKQETFHNVDSFYQNWTDLNEKLSENKKGMSEISLYIETLEQEKGNIKRETRRIEKRLESLLTENLQQQEAFLEYLLGKNITLSTKEIVEGLLQRIKTEREEIDDKKCAAVARLKAEHQLLLKKYHGDIEDAKQSMLVILGENGIEIEGDTIDTYIYEDTCHPVKNAGECAIRISTVRQQISYIESEQSWKNAAIKRNEKWQEMSSTRFFQQKVAPFFGRRLCTANIEALNAAIEF